MGAVYHFRVHLRLSTGVHRIGRKYKCEYEHICDDYFLHKYVHMMKMGNGASSFILPLSLFRKLQFVPLIHPCPIQFRVIELPNTHILCKVKSLHAGDPNSDVTVYYQVS